MTSRNSIPFRLNGFAAWTPSSAAATSAPVPTLLRRRVSPLGQQALRLAWLLPETATARIVVSSRHGEFDRTLAILDTLVAGVPVSPADFTLSVHHALAGLLSIARSNHQGHTAIAAGSESFGFGMIEALCNLAETPDQPVVLLHYDAPLPAPYDDFDACAPEPEALALVLTSASLGAESFSLTTSPAGGALGAPASQAAIFQQLIVSPQATAAVTTGARFRWHWRRHNAVV